jgi:hypothetical protein
LALQLTDFGQFDNFCAGCPLQGLLCDEEEILDLLDTLRSGSFAEIMALYDTMPITWHMVTYQDVIDYETTLAWEEYKPATNVTQDDEETAADSGEEKPPSLAQRLHDMEWTIQSTMRPHRRGVFFRRVPHHGTASQRKGRLAEDRRRKRQARRNRHTSHYTPAHKIRDYRTDLVTWGTAEDRFEEGYTPSWEDALFFDNAGYLYYEGLFDPYEENELALFDRTPVLAGIGGGLYDDEGFLDDYDILSRHSYHRYQDEFDWDW